MTILETGDATEVESVLDVAHAIDGPVYIRMLRGEIPRLFPVDEPMRLGAARDLTPQDVRGGTGARDGVADVVVLTSGICTQEALRALPAVRARGITVRHLHVSTLKPFDDPAVESALRSARVGVVTMENHLTTGGLGTAVSETMTDLGIGVPLARIGIDDRYLHGASQQYLTDEYGLNAPALVRRIEGLLGRDLAIGAEEYAAELALTSSDAKADQL